MARVAILSPSLTTADGVSNDALGMYEVLRRRGDDVRLFCESHSFKHSGIGELPKIEKFLERPNDILIYHHSHGWDRGVQLVKNLPCFRVIRYHNVTPAHYFAGVSQHEQELSEAGRRQLGDLTSAQCELYLSASAFSMRELIDAGGDASRSFVVPPFNHIDRLARIKADQETLAKYSGKTANILFVGRVLPHKNVHHLIEAFAHYHYGCNRASRLLIAGKGGEGLSNYSKLLRRVIDKLRLTNAVVFLGGVSDEALKACYEVADVFVTVSEHEGFCVPLIEAMSMKVPITAYAAAAIPETIGDAGIVWAERNPSLIAESIDLLVRNKAMRKSFAQRGLRRYRSMFTTEQVERSFLKVLTGTDE